MNGISPLTATAPMSAQERMDLGRARRKSTPRSVHGQWAPSPDRPDPVELLEEQNAARVEFLIPIRRARMAQSPFAFYRGAARIMAADLAGTPDSGLVVQACGDAHLSNFGFYASPERRLVFDVNDFDETLPGPWEWDLKRLAASIWIAAEAQHFSPEDARATTESSVTAYSAAMSKFAGEGCLQNWYEHLDVDEMLARLPKTQRKGLAKLAGQARKRTRQQALAKYTEKVGGSYRIKSQPPLLVPLREIPQELRPEVMSEVLRSSLDDYLNSLPDNLQHLMSQYQLVDIALKVVGVGSVGTRCLIGLFLGRDGDDPLFLQIKEATRSVLEEHLPMSRYEDSGQRVVEGQQLLQSVSDIFLGWNATETGKHFYWRQLRDWKGSVEVDRLDPDELARYATVCGWALAHGHARSGDAIAISAYLGSGRKMARAIGTFAESYAEQNERDYQQFLSQIKDGTLSTKVNGPLA